MLRLARTHALVLSVLVLAGCTSSNKDSGGPTSPPDERQFEVNKNETVQGPLNQTWTWTVKDTQYKSYSISLNMTPPANALTWSAQRLNVRLTDGAGQVVKNVQNADYTGPSQKIITCVARGAQFECSDFHGPTATGLWTLKLNATSSSARYDVQVHLLY
jgi:hypothetical protein